MAKRQVLLAILLASIAFIAKASAEEFPSRPITWVVPFAPGGITDTTSRIVAEEMSRTLGQSVLIDNRGGGGGTVGTEQVARAKPDGYTMIYGTQGTMAANVTLRKNLSYDPLTSFCRCIWSEKARTCSWPITKRPIIRCPSSSPTPNRIRAR